MLPDLWGVITGGEDIVWRIRDRLVRLRPPLVMGILNRTPDSFVGSTRLHSVDQALRSAKQMVKDGAAILDVGGASTRPGAPDIPADEECRRTIPTIVALRERFPGVLISVDTWRARVAREAVDAGASLVNDISAGLLDPGLLGAVAALHVPYILMHMQGTPRTMQHNPTYADVLAEVVHFLGERILAARQAGIADLVVDPGFGFGKDRTHNFTLLEGLGAIRQLGVPVLAGLSRKRMLGEITGREVGKRIPASVAAHLVAAQNGAAILRVHDVEPLRDALALWNAVKARLRPSATKSSARAGWPDED